MWSNTFLHFVQELLLQGSWEHYCPHLNFIICLSGPGWHQICGLYPGNFPLKCYIHIYIHTQTYIYTHIHICMYINIDSYLYMLSHSSHVGLFVTLWTIACQAHLSMSFSRQKWSPCPAPGIFPTQGSNTYLLYLLIGRQVLCHYRHLGSPYMLICIIYGYSVYMCTYIHYLFLNI